VGSSPMMMPQMSLMPQMQQPQVVVAPAAAVKRWDKMGPNLWYLYRNGELIGCYYDNVRVEQSFYWRTAIGGWSYPGRPPW